MFRRLVPTVLLRNTKQWGRAGALVAALVCSVAPAPAYALRAVGLEEGKSREDLASTLHNPSSATPATPSAAAGLEGQVIHEALRQIIGSPNDRGMAETILKNNVIATDQL